MHVAYRSGEVADKSSPSLRCAACWLPVDARCRARPGPLAALVTVPVVSSTPAASGAERPSTSRSTSAARWRPGGAVSAATNASSTPPGLVARSGPGAASGAPRAARRDRAPARRLGRRGRAGGSNGSHCAAGAAARPAMVRQRLVAIRYSHAPVGAAVLDRPGRARPAEGFPAPRPRRRAASRACGSSAPPARCGAARLPSRSRPSSPAQPARARSMTPGSAREGT